MQASFKKPKGHPVDYFVPNFGVDKDILTTQRHIKEAETQLKRKMVLSQTEEDIRLDSDPICSSAGCDQYKHKKPKLGYDIDYPVPDFGADPDMEGTLTNEALASKMVNHNWEFGTEESKAKWHNVAKDTLYDFAPHLDGDMQATEKHLGDAEDRLNHKWVIQDVQTEENMNLNSDPICSSAGCDQYKHKKPKLGYDIDYPVPNFGPDPDMVGTLTNEALASRMVNHNWEFGTEESKAKWHNVAKDTLYDFAPNLDGDMVATEKHLGDAETRLNHKWVIE